MAGWLVSSILAINRSVAKIGRSLPSSSTSTDPRNVIEEDLRKLERTLERIQAVLHDAEEREIRDASVKLWLRELRGVAYDAEDVLEDYRYEVLRSEAEARAATTKVTRKRKRVEEEDQQQQVCDLVSTFSSSCKISIPDGIGDKIREIRMRFDEIAKEREALHLRPGDGERRFEPPAYPPPSGSLVDNTGVFGRKDDKKKVIKLLFSDEGCRFSVVPIVGMGGLGKTTLAQLVYNDPNICKHFNLQGWVSVSVDFDVPRIMRAIIESISNVSCNLTELSSLQDALRKQVEGKRVLVVLDDVWNEKRSLWESLQVALLGGKWVRVIATTRNDSVAKIMQTVAPYNLDGLPEDQCMLLFQRHAFGAENPAAHEKQQLVEIGEKIVKKCAGLPLAVKALACLLGGETDVERWEGVLNSDMWELDKGEDEILPALWLSYHRLPTYLKPCFVYCSMFPKGHRFKKDDLIRQWMAQGYIQLSVSSSIEDTGSDYFDQLLRRSFFQKPPYTWEVGEERFVIHDLMVDLALSISWEDRCGLTWREARHLYMTNEERDQEAMMENLSSCHKPTALRTLFLPDSPIRGLGTLMMKLLNVKYLRALSWVKIEWLPDSVGSISKHLRYLGLDCESVDVLPGWLHQLYSLQTLDLRIAHSKVPLVGIGRLANLRCLCIHGPKYPDTIEKLPESFCQLHNLWTLDLSNCEMEELPSGLGDLINLRHLFLPFLYRQTHGSLGKLTNLRSLSQFNVARCRCTGIGELKGMVDLRGDLTIHGLENVGSPAEARQADLRGKHRITKLTLYWDGAVRDVELEAAVLESLRPHTNLQELTIFDYQGFRIPCWMADPSFSQLTNLTLWRTESIVFLPPLGRLPALKSLFLFGLNGVRRIGHDFSSCLQGENTTTMEASKVGFPSLEGLSFFSMAKWEEWDGVQDGDFPHLEFLTFEDCPKLRRLPTVPLLQSLIVSITNCYNFSSIPVHWNRTSIGRLPTISLLRILTGKERRQDTHIDADEGISEPVETGNY